MIPQTLFNTNMFVDGQSLQGDVPSLSLPKVTVKTEEYRGGGMDAPVGMDMGLEKLEASFTTNSTSVKVSVVMLFNLVEMKVTSPGFLDPALAAAVRVTGIPLIVPTASSNSITLAPPASEP